MQPFKRNGYTANNEDELRDLYECDIISLEEFEALTSSDTEEAEKIANKRKSYKKLWLEEKEQNAWLAKRYENLEKQLQEVILENLRLKGESNNDG